MDETEQEVLRTDVVVAEHPGLFLRQDDNPSCSIVKPLEHDHHVLQRPAHPHTEAYTRAEQRKSEQQSKQWKSEQRRSDALSRTVATSSRMAHDATQGGSRGVLQQCSLRDAHV